VRAYPATRAGFAGAARRFLPDLPGLPV